jgi:hypothetical protein
MGCPLVDIVEDTVGNLVDLVTDTASNVVNLVTDTVGNVFEVIGDAVDWVMDDIINPVVSTVGDIIQYALDNPIEALATLAVTIGAPYLAPFLGTTTAAITGAAKWVIPLASGTQTLVNGGSLEDAIKSAAISFAGTYAAGAVSKAVSPTINQATQAALGSTQLSTTVASVLNTSTTAAAKTFVATGGDAKAALKSFTNAAVMGGVQGGLEAATDTIMGSIEQSFKDSDFGKSVNSLSKGVKESIYAGIAAELTGQDLSEQAIFAALDSDGFVSDIVGRYAPVAKFMDGLVTDAKEWLGKDLSETQIKILTDAVGASWSIAKAGNPDLAGEAFFGSMQKPAYEALIDTLSDPIDKALDSITGASKKAELAAAPLNEALLKTSEATAGYNALQKELADDLKTNEALKTTYNAAVNAYNQNKTEATKAALESAATALTNHSEAFNASYPATKAKMDAHEATYNKYFPTIDTLQAAYDKASTYVMQDIEDLDATLKPLLSGVDRVIATTLRPGIDEDSYRKANGLAADVDVYTHYLANQKEADYKISVDAVSKFNSMMKAGDIEGAMSLPNMPSADTLPNTYGPPSMPKIPGQDALPNVDLTVPSIAGAYRGDPRQYGLTPEAIAEYKADTSWSDAWYNFKSGGLEAVGLTVGGFGTALNEMSENIQNAFKLDASTANDLAGQNYAIYYDPNLTDDQKRVKIEALTEDYLAAVNRDLVENGVGDVTFFTEYTDPLKQYIMDSSKAAGDKISPEMQVRQYNALPREDTTWEQILTGKAKDRLGRPYGLGDPLATMMSGVQELPDLLTDVALFALTKNPAIFAASSTIVTATSMLEAGEAAADEIKSNLNSAYTSGELQKTPEFVDLVRAYGGDEEAALAKLIDQGMDYAATSGVIGGFADVILAKVAAASGGSILLKNVPTGLKTVVKVGTGGVSEGITESFEQVPINLASINAGLDVAVNKDTGVAFLQALTSGGTATLGSASLDAVKHTLKAIKNGTYSIKLPDGTTVTPDKPMQGEITSATDTINNLDRIQAYSGLLNNLSSWGVIPSDPKLGTGAALVDTLKGLGITDTDTLTSIANISYSADYTTPEEISTALKFMSPDADATALPFSDKLVQDAIKEFSGATAEADLNRLLETYINPRYITREEVKKAAAEEGITLTDEQAGEYAGEGDQDTVLDEVIADADPLATTQEEAKTFFTDLGFTPTDEQVAQFVGATSEEEQKAAIAKFVDPRQTTEAEARKFFTDQGYEPTDAEVAARVGQGEDTFEADTKAGVEPYINPRQTTEAEARKFFTDQGYEPTDAEVAARVGQGGDTFEADTKAGVEPYVNPRQTTEAEARKFFTDQGYEPTDAEVAARVGQGEDTFETDTKAGVEPYVNPRQVTDAEARQFFTDLGFTPTDEQVAQFVGAKTEEEQKAAIVKFVDPLYTDSGEAKALLTELGYNPTDEEVTKFVGQVAENKSKTLVSDYVDPRQTTEAEARKFFTDQGYEPTDAEVAARVGQITEADAKEDVGAYINPRQTTEAEARKFFTDQGYEPTDAEVAARVGQGGDTFEADTKAGVEPYVNPRQTTEAEVRQAFADQGYEPTDAEVADRVGQGEDTFETDTKAGVEPYVNPRQTTEAEVRQAFADQGYEPTDAEVADRVGQGGDTFETDTKAGVEPYVDPRQVTDAEARQFFADLGYNDPTDEQVAQFVAQVEEKTQQEVISKYVDPRQVTRAELEVIAAEEGLTLTDVLADAYVGQSEAENFAADTLDTARKEYDPLATTQSEAEAFFASTGYTATPAEIATFVASKAEDVQTSAIGAYVDPRQITADEAKEFLSSIGYNPTAEEIAQFTGQLNDDTYQVTQKTAIDKYVDPRYVDAGEVRAAYEKLGLVDVAQEDVDRFVGQYMEKDQLDAVKDYVPTATFNVIKSLMGSPSIADNPDTDADESKDATGIYKLIEDSENAGATRDEALQDGIDALGDELGLTRDELLAEIGLTKEELTTKIDTVSEDVAGVTKDVAGLTEDVAGLDTKIGDLGTDLTKLIEDNAGDVDAALKALSDDLGTTEEALLEALGTTKDALSKEFTEGLSAVGDILGTPGVADDPSTEADETQDATGLFATIAAYEAGGLSRDEALQKAIEDVSGALGTTKTDLLASIGETETSLLGAIGETETSLLGAIGETETKLTDKITGLEKTLGTDIQAVADLVGKPAREVTQADIDFVIDLIAQENVSAELIAQYDVTGDGIVDINDQTMLETALQGGDVTLAATSMFDPATGLYLQQEQDTQALLDEQARIAEELRIQQELDTQTVLDQNTELNTQLNTQINTNAQQKSLRDFLEAKQSGAFDGGGYTATTPDPIGEITPYDWQTIFRDQEQAGRYANPYGPTRATPATPANLSTRPLPSAAGFAAGGQVEDINAMLLKLLGDT